MATLPNILLGVSLRDGDASQLCLRNITALRLSTVAIFSRVTLATVDWNRDQFCETALRYLLYLNVVFID